jgi:hypothetical protein
MRSLSVLITSILWVQSCFGSATANKPEWMQNEKIRAYWGAPYELIKPLKEAGFNAVIQRIETAVYPEQLENEKGPNAEGLTFKQANDEFIRESAFCKKIGMRYFPCINTGAIKEVIEAGFKDNPRRYHDGRLPCPLDEVYWNRVIVNRFESILNMLAGSEYRVDGLFIDPEMYYLHGNFYTTPCYCEWCRADFAKAHPEAGGLADVNSSKAPQWLGEHKLNEIYNKWQSDQSFKLIKAFERRIHARRPDLALGFVIWEDTPWFRTFARGLSSDGLPVVVVTELPTYSGAFDDSYLGYEKELAREVPVNFINCPGVWINSNSSGQVPQRLLKVVQGNVYNRAILSDGYLVYASDRWGGDLGKAEPYLKSFKTINLELDKYLASKGEYKSDLKPNRLPVDPPGNLPGLLKEAQGWKVLRDPTILCRSNEVPQLRETEGQSHVIIFKADKDATVHITMHTVQLSDRYIDKGTMSIYGPNGSFVGDAYCECNKSSTYELTALQAGAYAVVATANSNAYTIDVAGAPWAINTRTLKLNHVGGRMFFHVPAGQNSIKVRFAGTGEAADYSVYQPDGKKVLDEKQVRELKTAELDAKGKPGTWCVEVGGLEDDAEFSIEGISVYSRVPEQILTPVN